MRSKWKRCLSIPITQSLKEMAAEYLVIVGAFSHAFTKSVARMVDIFCSTMIHQYCNSYPKS